MKMHSVKTTQHEIYFEFRAYTQVNSTPPKCYTTTKLASYDSNFTPKSLQSHSHSVSANNSHNAACFLLTSIDFSRWICLRSREVWVWQPAHDTTECYCAPAYQKSQKYGSSFITLCCFFPNSFPQIVRWWQIGFLFSVFMCTLYSIGFLCIT